MVPDGWIEEQEQFMKRAVTVSGSPLKADMRGGLASVALPIRYAERRMGGEEAGCYCTSSSLLVVRSFWIWDDKKILKSESHGLFFAKPIGLAK